jgi:predicted double-glycine peptidase
MGLKKYPIPRGAIRIPVPDTTQQTDYSCGASSLQAICKYYGVGYDDEWEVVDG